MLRHYLFDRHRMQLGFLIKGFSEVVPPALVSVFTSAEFEALISGADRIDVDDWAASTQYRGKYMKNKEQHEVIDWWWTYVRSLTREDQARLLRFCTGSSRVPIMGFKSLQGDDGASMPFSIDSVSLATAVFPRAHTCFNRCVLFFLVLRSRQANAQTNPVSSCPCTKRTRTSCFASTRQLRSTARASTWTSFASLLRDVLIQLCHFTSSMPLPIAC